LRAACGGDTADPEPSVSISEPPPTSETPSTATALRFGDPASPTASVKASVLDYRPNIPATKPRLDMTHATRNLGRWST
jgi:hypothetical protein